MAEVMPSELEEGISQLQDSEEMFNKMTEKYHILTGEGQAVISAIITYDASSTICITKEENTSFESLKDVFSITSYNLTNFRRKWTVEIVGDHLCMSDVVQSDDSKTFAIPYQDNGTFFVKLVDSFGVVVTNLNVTKMVGLDNGSKPIEGVYDPLITCCFLPNERIFIAAYHRLKKRQHHFVYSLAKK